MQFLVYFAQTIKHTAVVDVDSQYGTGEAALSKAMDEIRKSHPGCFISRAEVVKE